MKTLLCAREITRTLLRQSPPTEGINGEEEDDEVTQKAQAEAWQAKRTASFESLYDSAEMLVHSDIDVDRAAIMKVAIQLQLNCCRLPTVPLAFFEKTTKVNR